MRQGCPYTFGWEALRSLQLQGQSSRRLHNHQRSDSFQWCFMTYFGIFELGSLLCALAKDTNMLIVARAIAGLGASGLINGALTIVAACIPLEKRAGRLTLADFKIPY
jgi:MFS family permease